MARHDSLGDRMKRYECATRTTLTPRTPVIVRVDGKAFHAYTRGLPAFHEPFGDAMAVVAWKLCEGIQGAVMAYVQSDEVSVLVHPYKRYATSAWFDGQVQKTVSVAASIASSTMTVESARVFQYIRPAVFDARAFVLPEGEVANYFVWRQQDAVRNSVQMHARSMFSHKQCDHKNCDTLKAMCADAGKPWDDLLPRWRQGIVSMRGGGDIPGRSMPAMTFADNRDVFALLLATEEE